MLAELVIKDKCIIFIHVIIVYAWVPVLKSGNFIGILENFGQNEDIFSFLLSFTSAATVNIKKVLLLSFHIFNIVLSKVYHTPVSSYIVLFYIIVSFYVILHFSNL